jgi:hypothetical protein
MTTKSKKNPAAVALGKLAAGKPKNYSREELAKRTARLRKGRAKNILAAALLGTCVLAGNVKADDTYYQYDSETAKRYGIPTFEHHPDGEIRRQLDVRGNVIYEHRDDHPSVSSVTQGNVERAKEMREEAREYAAEQAAAREAAVRARAETEKHEQALYVAQAERNRRRDESFIQDARSNPFYHTDSIPLASIYDDEATIRTYLHDSGYTDLSDADIATVRAYMHAHGIRHVSEL